MRAYGVPVEKSKGCEVGLLLMAQMKAVQR